MDQTIKVSETVKGTAEAAAAVVVLAIISVVFVSVVKNFKQEFNVESEPKKKTKILKIK